MSLTRRSLLVLLLVLGLVAASAVVIAVKPTVLGLDLEGGVEVILQGKPTATAPVDDASIGRAIEIIRNRVDRFGVSEPEIQRQGDDQITVSLPGAKDPERVVEDLIKPAQLFFYDYQANLLPPEEPTLYAAATRAAGLKPEKVSNPDAQPSYYLFRRNPAHTLVAGPEVDLTSLKGNATQIRQACGTGPFPGTCKLVKVPKGLVIFKNVQQLPGSSRVSRTVWDIMKDNPGLRGKDITSARQQLDQSTFGNNEPIVTMQFTDQGRKLFQQVTKDLATRGALRQQLQSFAIVLDGVIISNPTVDYKQYPQGIDGSNGAQIQGNFTVSSARTLADQLNSGAIPIKLEPISLRQVSATLGKQSLREGLIAGIVGLALVMIFLVAYYRILGLVADAALLIYGLLFYAVVKLVPITMTLPGIAGMILTIGVAADANVVIFERIREEARAGRSPRAAVLNGYKRGISAIIDANVVTLGTAAILFLFATAGVKGFAFTLFVGVILSLFTAVLATRAVFGLLADTKLFRNERLMGLHQREIKWKFDFVGYWKLWLAISFIPLALGAFWIGIKGLNLGLDFESGTRISVTYGGAQPSENSVRAAVDKAGFTDAKVQATTETLNGRTVHGFQIQTKTLSPGEQRAVTRQLDTLDGGVTVNEVTTVGPTFGRQIIRNAIYAILISFALIIVYLSIRFEYKLAVPALISVIHDVWLALSIYSIVGREVTSATVAAILTILGYSLYDVVIVFDRIRENVPLMRSATYRQIVNRSVHETLTRSIITSVTTLLPVAVLYLFGGDTLKDFAFALLVGILSGGLSSIAIAAPLVALWKEREPQARKRVARQAKKRRRLENIDADVVDVTVLERAEAALDARIAEEERVDEYHGLTLEPEEEPEREPEPERRGRATTPRADNGGAPEAAAPAAPAEVPPNGPAPEPEEVLAAEEPAAEEPVGDEPAGEEPAPSKPAAPAPQRPERVRRHRQVQRKKGGRR